MRVGGERNEFVAEIKVANVFVLGVHDYGRGGDLPAMCQGAP